LHCAALFEVIQYTAHEQIRRVIFVVFSERDYAAYEEIAPYWFPGPGVDEEAPTAVAQASDNVEDGDKAHDTAGAVQAADAEADQAGTAEAERAPPSDEPSSGSPTPAPARQEGQSGAVATETPSGHISPGGDGASQASLVRKRGSSSDPEAAPAAVKVPPRRDAGSAAEVLEKGAGAPGVVEHTEASAPPSISEQASPVQEQGKASGTAELGTTVSYDDLAHPPPPYTPREGREGSSSGGAIDKKMAPTSADGASVDSTGDVTRSEGARTAASPTDVVVPGRKSASVEDKESGGTRHETTRPVSGGRSLGPTSSQIVEDIVDDWDMMEEYDVQDGKEGGASKAGKEAPMGSRGEADLGRAALPSADVEATASAVAEADEAAGVVVEGHEAQGEGRGDDGGAEDGMDEANDKDGKGDEDEGEGHDKAE
jgi:hypothetical protein